MAPGRTKVATRRIGVHTVWQVRYVRRLASGLEFSKVMEYDELERQSAESDFQVTVRQAQSEVGNEVTVGTSAGNEASGRLMRAVVDLCSVRVGEWTSPPRIEMQEVVLDDQASSPRARLVRDGLLSVPVGERGALLSKAIAEIGTDASVGAASDSGGVCVMHNRWVGRTQLNDRCWAHVWGKPRNSEVVT